MRFRRRQPLDFHVEISPLIDVVFLLLIFFMVSTTFVEESALDVELPESGSTTERPAESIQLVVRADGTLSLEGVAVEESALAEALRARLEEEPDRPVVVKGDGRVPHARMVKVYDAVREAGSKGMVLDAVPPADGADPAP